MLICATIDCHPSLLSVPVVRRQAFGQQDMPDPLPSWNDGPAKKAILDFVRDDHRQGEPQIRAARAAHRHLRPGRHAVGRASDVHAGGLLPGTGAGRGEAQAGIEERRAVQDGALRQPRSDREAAR